MKKFLSYLAMAAVVAVVGFGCCACRQASKNKINKPLTETKWHLVKMMETDAEFDEGKFNIVFAPGESEKMGHISGVGACNHIIGGEFEVGEKGKLSVGQLGATRMACPELELEIKFFEILRGTTHYEIDGDVLMLLRDGVLQATLQAVEEKQE